MPLESLDQVIEAIQPERENGARIAFVSGNFNILHPGHFRLLRFAAESADLLVIGVFPDGSSGVAASEGERLAAVQTLNMVRAAFILRDGVEAVVAALRPDVVVKGMEYENRPNPEQPALAGYGGRLLFSSGQPGVSSPRLLQQELESDFSSIHVGDDYLQRHRVTAQDLKHGLSRLKGIRVLVIGDLIVDTYINCDPVGMSQEDPTLVITPIEEKTFVGGAGIVAAHAAGLGGEVRLITIVGEDDKASFARSALADYRVTAELIADPTRPTTLKQRYRARGQTLLRVNHMRQHPADQAIGEEIVARAAAAMPDVDLLLFADFNYGCLPQGVVDAIIALARQHGVAVCADSQASSQNGDVSRFRGMDLIAPTEHEARLALQDFHSGLAVIAEALRNKAQTKHLLITLGAEGLLAFSMKNEDLLTDRLPAFNRSPRDPAGAGDALFVSTAMAMRGGMDFWTGTVLGAMAAACQVSRVGNTPLTSAELLAEFDYMDI